VRRLIIYNAKNDSIWQVTGLQGTYVTLSAPGEYEVSLTLEQFCNCKWLIILGGLDD
jgi:hypothetical protein